MTENEVIEELKENIEMPFGSNVSDDASRLAIKALEEIQQYRAIGTVKECRNAVEKQKTKKPIYNGKMALWDYICPVCGEPLIQQGYKYNYCDICGQAIDWSEVN